MWDGSQAECLELRQELTEAFFTFQITEDEVLL